MEEKDLIKLNETQIEAAKIAAQAQEKEEPLPHPLPVLFCPAMTENGQISMVKTTEPKGAYVTHEAFMELYNLLLSHEPNGRAATNADFSQLVGLLVSVAGLLKDFTEVKIDGTVAERLEKIKILSSSTHHAIMKALGQDTEETSQT